MLTSALGNSLFHPAGIGVAKLGANGEGCTSIGARVANANYGHTFVASSIISSTNNSAIMNISTPSLATNNSTVLNGTLYCGYNYNCSPISFDFTPPVSCGSGNVIANSNSGSGNWTLTSTTGAVVASQSGVSSVTFTNIPEGIYNLSLNITSGACTQEVSKRVEILSLPVATFTFTPNPTTGLGYNFSATYANMGYPSCGTTYSWSFGDGATSNLPNPNHLYTLCNHSYNVCLTVSNSCGTTTTCQTIISSFSANITLQNVPLCLNGTNSPTLLASVGGTQYSWSGPNNFTATVSSVTPLGSGIYQVTITRGASCTASASYSYTAPTPFSVNISATNPDCVTGLVTLTGSSGAVLYQWSSANGFLANGQTVNGSYPNVYVLTATNTNGCTATASYAITVNTTLPLSITGTTTTCNNTPTTLAASSVWDTYVWSNSAGQSQFDPTYTVTQSGVYTLWVSDASGNCTASASATVTIRPAITASIAGNTSVCAGSSVLLSTNITTGTGPFTYAWSNGGGSGASATFTPTAATTTYSVTITGADGCMASASRTIVINTPTISITGANSICAGTNTIFTASGASSYIWSNGANTSSTTLSTAGIYTVTGTDANGCTASASRTVTVNTLPTVSITGTNSICAGTNTTFTAIGGSTYLWSNGANTPSTIFSTAGTYIVTGTDANGCSASASHILTVIPAPVVSITGNNSICVGASTILTASGGNIYTWSNNLGNNATSLPITASGTYSVTATDVNTCTASASIAVNVNLNVPNINIAQTGSSCIGGSLQLTATGSTSTYEWSGPNSYSATGGAINITASLLPSTVDYTVTATAANGCTASATTQVSVDPTCLMCGGSTTTIDLLITEPDLATFIANNSAYPDNLTGLNIYVANNFEINTGNSSGNPYLIDDCHITFASGVQLIIPNGRQLTIDNSTLESCEFLWVGIFADEQSALRMTNSTITDAYLAIMANDQCRLELNNTLFDRNYIGIHSSQLGASFALAMQNTTFDCTATLLPLEGVPSLQNWAYAGIDLTDNGYLDITSPSNNTSTLNVFKNVANGIVANQCGYLGVQNCKFQDILPRSQFTDHYNGSGIVLLGTKDFNHIGLGTGTQLFSNCNFGVYNQQSNIYVSETRMDKMNIGVYSRLCNTGERIIVTNNYINTNRTSAVYLWQCDGASYVDIANNSVSVSRLGSSTTARHGILVNNFGTGASGFTRIRCNAVQVDNGWNGVNILNGQQYKVLENEVLLTDVNINQQGINVSNNNATAVLQNIVNSTFRPHTQNSIHYSPTAIKADNSVDGLYSDNLMSNTYTGLLMAGVSSGSEVKQNQFGDHYWGMNFTTTLVLNDQIDKGNTWIGAYGNADARHEGVPYAVTLPSFALQGQFKTLFSSTYTPSNIITTNSAASPGMWFSNSGVNPTIVPPASYCVEYAGGGEIVKRLSTHDIAIAKGELVTAEYPEEMEWWAKERLYNLLKDSIAWSLDTTLVNFKDSSELTTSKAFYDLRQDYKTWLSPDASLEAQYETVMASMQDQEALIKAKQEEIAVADSTQVAALYVELGILTSDYKDLKVLLEQVKLSLETLRTQTAEDIKGNNATINTAALYESNQKIVNDIYYSTIAKGYGEFRPAQVALLANIANQCPFAGGPAVYQARSLYAAVVDTLYDDKAICQQVNIAYRPTSTTLTESASQAFKVFPNPAQTDLTVLAESALTEDTQLSLINTLGQVELSVWLNKGTTQKTISLAAIPNGLYICKIGQSVSYKLIVMKP